MRRAVRILVRLALALVLLMALAAGVLAYLAAQPAVLEWLLAKGAEAAGGSVRIESLAGSLVAPISARRLVYEDASLRIEAADFELRIESLWKAWRARELHVERLAASRLDITSKQTSTDPAGLPASLALPAGVVADDVDVASIVYVDGGTRVAVGDLRARYRYTPGDARHVLQLRSLATEFGRVSGDAALGADPPFRVEGRVSVNQPQSELPYDITVQAGGELARIGLGFAATVDFGTARGSLVLQPFGVPLIDRIVATTTDFDPRRVDRRFPQARISAEVAGGLGPDDRFVGTVRLANGAPGPIDRGRIPVVTVDSRITADNEGAQLTDLVVRTRSGAVRGTARFTRASVALDVRAEGLDAAEIHSRMRRTRLAGEARAEMSATRQSVRGTVRERDLALDVDAVHAADRVEVRAFELRAGTGVIKGAGGARLSGAQPFDLAATLAGFDPAALGQFPKASISGIVEAKGTLAAPRRIDGRFRLDRSTYLGYAVEGTGDLSVAGDRVQRIDAALDFAGNRVVAQGAFGAPGDVLRWSIDAPRIDRLGVDAAGRVTGEGTLAGTMDGPAIDFLLAGDAVRYATTASARTLSARGRYAAGSLDVTASARGLAAGGIDEVALDASLGGTREDHRLVATAEARDVRVETALTGALDQALAWRGRIDRLASTRRFPATLVAPVTLEASANRVKLGAAEIAVADGRVRIAHLERTPDLLTTEGDASGIVVAQVLAMADMTTRALADLRMGASWRVTAGQRLDAELRVARESGDLRISEEAARTSDPAARGVGLQRLEVAMRAERDRLSARIDVTGERIGVIRGEGSLPLQGRGTALTLAPGAPIAAQAVFEGGELGSLRPFLPDAVRLRGAVDGTVRVEGTLASPRMDGVLRIAGASFRVPDQGIRLRDGTAELRFDQSTVRIASARFAGERGSVSAEGELGYAGGAPRGRVQLRLEGLDAVTDPMFSVIASGTVTARIEGKAVSVEGDLRADQGTIRLPDYGGPTVSSDVVVLGRPRREAPAATEAMALPTVDLALALGDRFRVKGRGVDARLTGNLRLRVTPRGAILLTGAVSTEDGTVTVYGQTLRIEKGTVTFSGPIDNPALNLTAVRANIPMRVGVTVTGFVQEPRATLFSDTAMSDTERLAWLVFGRGAETLSPTDLALLGSVASAAIGGPSAPPIGTRIAGALGLDELAVRTAQGVESTVLALGKRVSDKLYVSFEQSIGGLGYALKLRYELSRNWSIQTQAGIDNTVDLLFTKRFD